MKKTAKILVIITMIISLFIVFAVQISAATNPFAPQEKITVEIDGNIFNCNVYSQSVTITGYSSTSTDVVLRVPETINGKPVTSLGFNVFSYDHGLKEVVIPDTITSISTPIFYDCQNLESIIFENMSNIIFDKSFIEKCPSLKNITFEKLNDFTIDSYSFNHLTGLETVTFQICENVTVKNYAFANSTIKNVVIPEGISLGQYVFSECVNLETAVINGAPLYQEKIIKNSSGVETGREDTYSEYLFNGCSNLKDVTLSPSYTTIYKSMFYECSSLQNVTMDYVTEIKSYAFYGCKALKNLELTNEVTIDTYSFQNCESLEYIDFSKIAMNHVPSYAFYGCSSLNNIDLSKINSVHIYGFYGCKALSNLGDFKPTQISQYSFYECVSLTNVDFSRLEEIENYGLAKTGFTYLELTNDYKLGRGSFAGCDNLKEVYIAESISTGS